MYARILRHWNCRETDIGPDVYVIPARIGKERSEQTVGAFSKTKLERAVGKLFEADRALRDARPDDRIVMEELILTLTAA